MKLHFSFLEPERTSWMDIFRKIVSVDKNIIQDLEIVIRELFEGAFEVCKEDSGIDVSIVISSDILYVEIEFIPESEAVLEALDEIMRWLGKSYNRFSVATSFMEELEYQGGVLRMLKMRLGVVVIDSGFAVDFYYTDEDNKIHLLGSKRYSKKILLEEIHE